MSITDELREYALGWEERNHVRRDLEHIADRIDAEHERTKQDLIDANNQMEQLCECSIELPKDTDGVPIHIGDVMESKGSDFLFGEASFEVRAMRHDEGGWEVYDRLGDRYAPSLLRHYHAPTVEDVLREFAERYLDYEGVPSAGRRGIGEALMDEYAAKLQLREDA